VRPLSAQAHHRARHVSNEVMLLYQEIRPDLLPVSRNGGKIRVWFMKNQLSGAVPVAAPRIGVGGKQWVGWRPHSCWKETKAIACIFT